MWKPIETAPHDRPVFLWDDGEGPVLMEWSQSYYPQPSWVRKSLRPNTSISHQSLYCPRWTYWCEVHEMRPGNNL